MDIRKFFSVANKTENYVSPEKTGEVAGTVLQSPEIVSEKDEGRVLNLPPPLPTCYTETVSEDEGRPPPPACTPSTDCTAAKAPSDLGRLLREEVEEGSQDDNEDAARFEDVGAILEGEGDDEGLQFFLPPHQRCASHTLNLIASKDLERALSQGATRKLFYSAMAKCSAIWNKAHRSPLAVEAVEEIGKMKLVIPCVTRWNSEYHAVQKIVLLTESQLAEVCEHLSVPKLVANELAFLKEYVEVLKPLACALDLLQGETKCFLGLVIPTFLTLKKRLSDKKPHVCFFSEVIDTVVKLIDSRFQKLLSSREAKLATASSPQFRLWWLPDEEKEDVRRMLAAEASNMEPAENTAAAPATLSDSGEEDFFSYGPGATRGTNSGPPEEVRKYLEGTNKKLGALEDFPTIKQVFIKYNTTLPSSAAVERLFSHGGNLFTPQRNRMTDEHFEQVLLLRYNRKICTVAVE
ncbi:hypothetical protein SKAU_G00277020 [Synaphobranchus kaupii]|uniref:HAT C-terminal dimerisation domain-containing protein n=1 Tax=Synaphobranchus kaupii TaxID=118154 RepID=A0A9Q1F1F9_SYNKA|nr:hypothetical protein SKAU_G00277020 [Synaphobranchus kaupii]